jgi:hypothetical protein
VSDSKNGLCQGEPLYLSQALPSPKQPNFKKLGAAGGLKCNGYSTQTEPIFESRAVYFIINFGISYFSVHYLAKNVIIKQSVI